ncbi:hypothetical protein T440DRAFT_449098 [Plenodomus tracheiphilus IPT5]|uniref:Anaphase-promoting complex subunit 2 n=1 Tax=Plenodomus tracheiphilus IPT5 TaxID=1408161 RepID=A0A6A7BAF5_9PLEO|nr:hypothetical protein T440DRAFT_449098 [Plenodomus tracheiphilus IPT5]
MEHSALIFASVFPVLSLSHTTPTPIATPDIGYTAPGSTFGSPYATRHIEAHGQGQGQPRGVRRNTAWSCATRFLSLPKGVTIAPGLHMTRETEEALNYLLLGDGKSDDSKEEEGLIEWYTNECRLHFASNVRPDLEELWGEQVELRHAWDVLEETQHILQQAQTLYSQPFQEHLLPILQQGASSTTLRPNRPSQVTEPNAADVASCKFERDIHAVFAHCLPLQRYTKTLSYVLYDAGCRLFRIYTRHDGVQPSMTPENTQEVRQRMTTLLRGLENVGLGGDIAQRAFAHTMNKLLDSFITSHYLKVDWYSQTSVVPQLRMWIQDGFCPLAELVLECLRCEQSSILPTEISLWQEMALGRLGRARVDNLFDFVINWDTSLGAVLDIKEYLRVAGAKQHLTSSFSQQISRRLLHPGATTTYILNVYISIIRSFHKLEPKGVLLERVARPIRRYLKDREDTARIIISSLLTDLNDETGSKFSSNSELSYEIASEMAKPFANFGQEADEELNWGDMNWQPLPQDASPEYKKSKVEDVIWFLLTLWDRDDFVNELKNIYGDHLLRCQDPEYEKEIRLLELIKIRLGDDKLQACEVMLRDVLDSKRINASIRATINTSTDLVTPGHHNRPPQTPDNLQPRTPRRPTRSTANLPPSTPTATTPPVGPALNAQILSSFFWPLLRDDTFRVPFQIDTLQKEYESRFERIKGMRKLRWMNALGESNITLTFDDRTEDFDHLTPWQVSVIHAFQPLESEIPPPTVSKKRSAKHNGEGISRTIPQLSSMLEMEDSLVHQALSFWVGKSVLRETSPSTFTVIERLSSSRTAADDAAAAAAEELATIQAHEATAVKSQQDLLAEKREVYELFILGMLTNQGNMESKRIAMMMRMMVQGGFPFGVPEVEGLLGGLEEKGKVVGVGGGVWGVGK